MQMPRTSQIHPARFCRYLQHQTTRHNAVARPCAVRRPRVHACFTAGPASSICQDGKCLEEQNGSVLVRDDLGALLEVLPPDIREPLINHPNRSQLLEVVLDLGRQPEARFLGTAGGEYLRSEEITRFDLESAVTAVGAFGGDNRAGVAGTLHRISCIRNRKGRIIGLTCRVGRAVTGHTDMIRDLVEIGHSVLIIGRPGVGKTTVIRELARVLADELNKRVVIVDSSNEIGGDGDVPHPAIGFARRMQVQDVNNQHEAMIEAVENHMPQVVVVDEISTKAEALACQTIAQRGVVLIGTAHGWLLENLIKNPTLKNLIGGIQSVTLGDDEASRRGTQKTILERKGPPTFPVVVEIRDRTHYVAHWVEDSVDALLQGKSPHVQVRMRDPVTSQISISQTQYDLTLPVATHKPTSSYDEDYDAALRKIDPLPVPNNNSSSSNSSGNSSSNSNSNSSSPQTSSSSVASPSTSPSASPSSSTSSLESSDRTSLGAMEALRLINSQRNGTVSGAPRPMGSSLALLAGAAGVNSSAMKTGKTRTRDRATR